MGRKAGVPSYCRRVINGKVTAAVHLPDADTGKRRCFNLGEYGSDESHELYSQIIADWQKHGRRLIGEPPRPRRKVSPRFGGLTLAQVAYAYLCDIQARGYSLSELKDLRSILRFLNHHAGAEPAIEFGPNRLAELREVMMHPDPGDPDNPDPTKRRRPRAAWCRKTILKNCHRIAAVFKWAGAREMLPEECYRKLKLLEPLRRGRTAARETEPVGPAPTSIVDAAMPFLSRQVAGLVKFQLLTGARPGEAVILRLCDLDTSNRVWVFSPKDHKSAWRERERLIYIGPKAQAVIREFLPRPTSAYLFCPSEAESDRVASLSAQRVTPLNQGNSPGTNKRKNPKVKPGDRYDVSSYRRAVSRACDQAFPPPAPLCRAEGETEETWRRRILADADLRRQLAEWRKANSYSPHQLRHSYATEIRRSHGLEVAAVLCGHSSAQITEAVYAERDRVSAMRVAEAAG